MNQETIKNNQKAMQDFVEKHRAERAMKVDYLFKLKESVGGKRCRANPDETKWLLDTTSGVTA